jgi:A/G-specific adenine glycosylase
VEELPNLGKREAATARYFIAFVIEHDGKFLVRQRPAGVVNAHLWEFPNTEVGGRQTDAGAVFQPEFAFAPKKISPLVTVKHSITRYRITLQAFAISLQTLPKKAGGVWKSPAQLRQLAFSSAQKKILARLKM